MLRRLISMLALAAILLTLLPATSMAQVPTPVSPPPGPTTGSPAEAPVRVPVPASASPEYGVGAYLMGYPESTARDIGLITDAKFQWVKLTVPWRSVEPSCKGCIDWDDLDRVVGALSPAGVKILARVDHTPDWARTTPAANGPPNDPYDYADFVSEMARRYAPGSAKGTINAIQVWNEPNLSREWGGTGVEPIINRRAAVDYMSMLRQSYLLIKEKSPNTIVVSAGLSPTGTNDGTAVPDDVYLEWLYDNDLDDYSDAIGMHAPGYGSPPEAELNSNPAFPHPSFYFRRVEQLHDIMVKHGDGAKQAWILEFGWTTDTVHPDRAFYAVTPDEQQGQYLVNGFKYAKNNWSPWIGPMFVWNMPDPTWTADNEQLYWSITGTDGVPRPAYNAIKAARTDGTLP